MARLIQIEGVWIADAATRAELEGLTEITFDLPGNKMTAKQRSSLHIYLRQVVQALNDAGLDQRKTLKPGVEIPWNETSCKDLLWRPLQKAMTDKQSTTELGTVDPSEIHKVLDRHLADRLQVLI